MKGDFSKNTFDKKKHFTSVRMQQGRVQLDSDWNEQMDIIDNRIRIGSMDFIGGSGTPTGDHEAYQILPVTKISNQTKDKKTTYYAETAKGKFEIDKPNSLTIPNLLIKNKVSGKNGHYYVQGILIESEKNTLFTEQLDFPNAVLPTSKGLYLAYLDVWQQGISAVDDPSITESALNGLDTTMRVKNIAQIKLLALPNSANFTGTDLKCEDVIGGTKDVLKNNINNKSTWDSIIAAKNRGKLTAAVSSNAHLKNQLYRIEIHKSGNKNTATFKWSRDNATLSGKIESINGNDITIRTISDKALQFKSGQWIELTTNNRTLNNKPGVFVRISTVKEKILTILSSTWPNDINKNEFNNGILRVWDTNISVLASKTTFINIDKTKTKRNSDNNEINIVTSNLPTELTKGQFIELTNKALVDANKEGYFAKVKNISVETSTLIVSDGANPITTAQLNLLDRFRTTKLGVLTTSQSTSIPLENGLSISFTDGMYKTGDYWLMPTRAETNKIESAQYDFSKSQFPEGIQHYYAQLALIRRNTDNTFEIAGDCRNTISALGNKAYKSDPEAPASSVSVDQNGNVTVKKRLKIEDSTELKKGVTVTGETKTTTLTVTGKTSTGSLQVNGGTILKSSLSATGNVSIEGSLQIKSSTPINIKSLTANSWTSIKTMPTKRADLTSDVVNGKIYVIAGGSSQRLTVVEMYDPVTNDWETKASMPAARSELTSSVVDGKIYVIGGHSGNDYLATVEAYDPILNIWEKKASLPIKRNNLASVAVNGKIYTMGGSNGSNHYSNLVEQYDPISNTWTTKAPMKISRRALTASEVNGKIYAIGGQKDGTALNTTEEYDPATNTWITKAPMLTPRSHLTSTVVNGKIYVIGGFDGGAVSTLEIYDPITNKWQLGVSMPLKRYALTSNTVNGKIYAIGGSERNVLDTVEVYIPSATLEIDKALKVTDTLQIGTNSAVVNTITSTLSQYRNTALPTEKAVQEKFSLTPQKAKIPQANDSGMINLKWSLGYTTIRKLIGNGWLKSAAMLTAKEAATANVINGKIYVIGGAAPGNPYTHLDNVEEYNPITNTWTTKASMPTKRSWLTSSVVNNKIYVFGGWDGSNSRLATVEEYDPLTNVWKSSTKIDVKTGKPELQPMPTARSNMSSAVVDGKIYVIGGYNSNILNVVEKYDPLTNAWKSSNKIDIKTGKPELAPMKSTRIGLTASTVNNKIYVFGGGTSFNLNDSNHFLNTVEEYNPATNTWQNKPPMSKARASLTSSVVNNKIYVIGGWDGSSRLTTLEEYDPIENTWKTSDTKQIYNATTKKWEKGNNANPLAPMTTGRSDPTSSVVHGEIYVVGGYVKLKAMSNIVEVYIAGALD